MSNPAKLVEQERVYEGRRICVTRDRVVLPNGKQTQLEVIRHPGAAAMVPVDSEGNVLLVKQVRHSAASWLLEVPAGTLEQGEDPIVCAERELQEEAGVKASRLLPLGNIWTSPGFTDECIWLYLALDLVPCQADLDEDEVLTVEKMPFQQAVAMALSGEIHDAKSVCALLRAKERLVTLAGKE